jgi:hypothetical protein
MKSLFEDSENETRLELGIENNGKLTIAIQRDNTHETLELDLSESMIFEREVGKYVGEMAERHAKQLPWWKRFGI